ncbi:hypothetical protein J5N97_015525 [Dioscorea zingiberensis]|uniref:CCHC-type domain-containing protein n=1 Tax=Dioscorea zingiberensis TaxID=325984 RepID=A0A9D5CUW0_9LILI|nr:hypothetical protein J5N97_015525 [Dioscorea zingiberensis]
MERAWRRKTGDTVTRETAEKLKKGEPKYKGAISTAIIPVSGSSRRKGVSYVAVVTHGTTNGEPSSLMEKALQGGGSVNTLPRVEAGEGSSDDGWKWAIVQYKRSRRRSPNAGTKPAMGREGRLWTRTPPPTRRTSHGIEEVCGKCYQPGHWARECKNREVCRRCGGEGHRERGCKGRSMVRVKDYTLANPMHQSDTGRAAPPPRKAIALGNMVEKVEEAHRRHPSEREELCEDNKGKACLRTGTGSQYLVEDEAMLGGASKGWKREREVLEMRQRLSPEPETHIRIRWGRVIPCRIKCTIGTHMYMIPVAPREGERQLPLAEEGDKIPGTSTGDQRRKGVDQERKATAPAKTPAEHVADHQFLNNDTQITEQEGTGHGARRAAVVPPTQGGKLEFSKNITLVGHVSRPNKIWVCRTARERYVGGEKEVITSDRPNTAHSSYPPVHSYVSNKEALHFSMPSALSEVTSGHEMRVDGQMGHVLMSYESTLNTGLGESKESKDSSHFQLMGLKAHIGHMSSPEEAMLNGTIREAEELNKPSFILSPMGECHMAQEGTTNKDAMEFAFEEVTNLDEVEHDIDAIDARRLEKINCEGDMKEVEGEGAEDHLTDEERTCLGTEKHGTTDGGTIEGADSHIGNVHVENQEGPNDETPRSKEATQKGNPEEESNTAAQEASTYRNKGKEKITQHNTCHQESNDPVRRSGRARKLYASRMEKEGFIALPTTSRKRPTASRPVTQVGEAPPKPRGRPRKNKKETQVNDIQDQEAAINKRRTEPSTIIG